MDKIIDLYKPHVEKYHIEDNEWIMQTPEHKKFKQEKNTTIIYNTIMKINLTSDFYDLVNKINLELDFKYKFFCIKTTKFEKLYYIVYVIYPNAFA